MSDAPGRVLYRGLRSGGLPCAVALAVEGGALAWAGPDAQSASWADNADEVVRLPGVLVTPGFVDSHVHLEMTGHAMRGLDLAGSRSRVEALQRLAAHVSRVDDLVVHGHGWDDSDWHDGSLTGPDLDRAANGRAVYLARVDAHSAIVSGALVDRVPSLRETDGWLGDGRVEREAHHLARAYLETVPDLGDRTASIATALRAAAAAGVVSVHEQAAPHIAPLEDLTRIRTLSAERVVPHVVTYWGETDAFDIAREYGVTGLAGDLNIDGSLGSRTAALHTPYVDDMSSGHLYLDADAVSAHVVACTRAELQAGFHVIGDRASEALIAGLRQARDVLGTDSLRAARHRVEHLEMPSGAHLELLAQLGVTASVQPAFDTAWGGDEGMYAARVGRDRARAMNPFAAMAAIGVPMAFGSDAPVTPFAPWSAIRAATRPRSGGRGLSVPAALHAHTVGGWHAARIDGAGTLDVGAPAHLAFWEVPSDADPLEAALAGEARCVRTTVSGRVAYDAATSSALDS
jgi:predicted amidohydrolase YtcJ